MNPWPVEARGGGGAPAAARPRRPGRRPEVRPQRRAQRPGARQRARDRRPGRVRRAGQGVPARARGRGALARRAASAPSRRRRATELRPGGLRGRRRVARCAASTPAASDAMVAEIDAARKANESLGGVFEVRAFGLVPGIGSHVSWEERLDGRLAQAIMSIQAMKGVGIGDGFDARRARRAREAHDEIFWSRGARLPPRDQPRGRARGRDDHRRAARRARAR